jgi:hypothetical protein
MEAIWFVRMAKPKARREPWIPPCLEQLNAWALLLLLFFLLVLCCMNLPRSRTIRCLLILVANDPLCQPLLVLL